MLVLVLSLCRCLMSHVSVDFFVLSFVLPCAYAYVASEDQAVDFDYILFRIDWLINLLIRYTSDERNDGAIILNRVINILRQVKDMLRCQDSNGSTSYQAGKIFTGMHR